MINSAIENAHLQSNSFLSLSLLLPRGIAIDLLSLRFLLFTLAWIDVLLPLLSKSGDGAVTDFPWLLRTLARSTHSPLAWKEADDWGVGDPLELLRLDFVSFGLEEGVDGVCGGVPRTTGLTMAVGWVPSCNVRTVLVRTTGQMGEKTINKGGDTLWEEDWKRTPQISDDRDEEERVRKGTPVLVGGRKREAGPELGRGKERTMLPGAVDHASEHHHLDCKYSVDLTFWLTHSPSLSIYPTQMQFE